MDLLYRFFNIQQQGNMTALLISAIAGITVLMVFAALLIPPKGRPSSIAKTLRNLPKKNLAGIQKRLDKAQMEISAIEYVRRSLTFGIPVGLFLALLVGSVVLVGVGIFAGFMITWTKLEQERDLKLVKYTKQLASACDTIRTAYNVNPSLKKAIEAVAEYSMAPVKDDFREILVAASQERFVEGLQEIAERRKSIVFDTVATSLIRASEASGEVNDMLVRLADSTRQNVGAFEDALTSQLNARSSITWGTYGPWLIFCIFRFMTIGMSLMIGGEGGNLFGPLTSFFSTIGGNILALAAALISIFVYRYATQVSQRGLVVARVSMSEPTAVKVGQRPLSNSQSASNVIGQSRPVAGVYGGENA
ncbi:MAG: type II secretion system F family protein [Chloroflexi bacterium]|nr:type II secretion system F family protein [Chloroflexota bacterium]MCL5275468.1 type II secretion system F family protein [Chloroflexota bacterium]